MEHAASARARARFGKDLRLDEVRRLLGSSHPVAVRVSGGPELADPDLVAHQQALLLQLAQRTTALPAGRGAFTLATAVPVLTEALPLPKLVLAGRLPAQQNATVNLDVNAGQNLTDLTTWPDFHNGVAAGLRLAPGEVRVFTPLCLLVL
jgi:anaphase-promoting complex subunit 1